MGVVPIYQKAESHLRAPNVKKLFIIQQVLNTTSSGRIKNNHSIKFRKRFGTIAILAIVPNLYNRLKNLTTQKSQ